MEIEKHTAYHWAEAMAKPNGDWQLAQENVGEESYKVSWRRLI